MRALFALVFLVGLLPVVAHAADLVGVWSAGEGKIRVKIDSCGEVPGVARSSVSSGSRGGEPQRPAADRRCRASSDLSPPRTAPTNGRARSTISRTARPTTSFSGPPTSRWKWRAASSSLPHPDLAARRGERRSPGSRPCHCQEPTLIRQWGSAKHRPQARPEAGTGRRIAQLLRMRIFS